MSSDAEADGEARQTYFVANPRSIDYKFTGKKDEFRFGVELKENKQFHHTKTGLDSINLGNAVNSFDKFFYVLIS